MGVAGRAACSKRLAKAWPATPHVFPHGRIADLLDHLASGSEVAAIAHTRFRAAAARRHLADADHDSAGTTSATSGPIRRSAACASSVSQALAMAHLFAVVPLMEGGYKVTGIDELTGLAEYRNGGLMLDGGLLKLRDPGVGSRRA